MHRIV
jgi:hypothetical protein